MLNRKLLRTLIIGLCATTGAIVACSHDEHRAAGTLPPTGESTAPGPADPTVPAPDSGLPASMNAVPSLRRVAEADGYASDAGVPSRGDAGAGRPIGGGDGGIGGGSGSASPPGTGSGSGMPRPVPGQPTPGMPAPGSPPPAPTPGR